MISFFHRFRLARDHRLIDRACAVNDGSVQGDLLAGSHDEDVADATALDGEDDLLSSPEDRRASRPQLHEGADGIPGATHGVVLENVGQGKEKEEQHAFEGSPDDRRAEGGENHEQVDIDGTRQGGGEPRFYSEYATGHVGKRVEHRREA